MSEHEIDLARRKIVVTYKLIWAVIVCTVAVCSSFIGGAIYITRYMEERKGIDNLQNAAISRNERDITDLKQVDKDLQGAINANRDFMINKQYNIK